MSDGRLINILALAQLHHLPKAGVIGKQKVDTLQGLSGGLGVTEPHDDNRGPIQNAEYNVELPPDVLDANGSNLDDQEGDEPLPDD